MSDKARKSIGWVAIEEYVWRVTRLLFKYGVDNALSDVAPLKWYISTGRASCEFLLALVNSKPYMIARKLHAGGSYNVVIDRIKKYIGFESCEMITEGDSNDETNQA